METMGDRLKKVLDEKAVSGRDLSRRIGMNENFVADVIAGRSKRPTNDLFDYLMAHYFVNVDWLVTGEGEMFLPGGKPGWTPPLGVNLTMGKYLMLTPKQQGFINRIINGFIAENAGE